MKRWRRQVCSCRFSGRVRWHTRALKRALKETWLKAATTNRDRPCDGTAGRGRQARLPAADGRLQREGGSYDGIRIDRVARVQL